MRMVVEGMRAKAEGEGTRAKARGRMQHGCGAGVEHVIQSEFSCRRAHRHVNRTLYRSLKAVGRLEHVPLHVLCPLDLHVVNGQTQSTLALHELHSLDELALGTCVPLSHHL